MNEVAGGKQKRVILLEAVSTGDQAEEGEISLPDQDERLRALASRNNWQIVDIIIVPGHSRVYYNYREFAEAALEEGISGPMRMYDHWKKRDFDVFACTSGDRFGREQGIFAEVVGRTIDCGAVVYTLRDGEINSGNKRMFVSMVGYSASVEIDELKRRRSVGMAKRASKGLPTSSGGLIPSHVVIQVGRDEFKTVVNPARQRMFADLAELLLAGKSWRQIAATLAERGHCRTNGRPFSPGTIAKWLMHPTLWGNAAEDFADGSRFSTARGFWVFDPAEEAPDYVTIYYHTHEPLYTGERAARVQAELRRRFGANGRAHPPYRGKFAGLVVCDSCHYAATYKRAPYYISVYCTSSENQDIKSGCTNKKRVNEKKLVKFFNDLLEGLLEAGDWSPVYAAESEADSSAARLTAVEAEIADTRTRAADMIERQSRMPKALAESFDAQLQALGETLERLQQEEVRLKRLARDTAPTPIQLQTLDSLREIGLPMFWKQADYEINQWVSRLMGGLRFVISEGEVVGITSEPKHTRRKSRD